MRCPLRPHINPKASTPPVKSFAAVPNEAEGALQQRASPLLTALLVLNTKPSSPLIEKKPSASTLAESARQSGDVGGNDCPSARCGKCEGAAAKIAARDASAASTDAKLSAPVFEKERWRPPVSDQPADEVPTEQSAVVASSAYAESVVTRAQRANSLLDELDLNAAIQLRWVMRDIRSKRTKFSPVNDNDLAALVNLGLVEMRDGLPRLTGLGVMALD